MARPASRFANFSRYGYAIGEVPEAVTDDFVTFLELSQADATWRSGRQHVRQPGSTAGLSDAEFALMQDVTSSSELAGLEECAICLNAVSAATPCKSLQCGHAFRAECVQVWLRRSRACPTCRQPAAALLGVGASSRGAHKEAAGLITQRRPA